MTESGMKSKNRLINYLRNPLAVFTVSFPIFLIILGMTGTAFAMSHTNHHTVSSSAATGDWGQRGCVTARPSQPSPVGRIWHLTVIFLHGSRQGQSEASIMTFLPNGRLTATFPGSDPGSPPSLPPAIDGAWCMTGPATFRYQFKDPIMQHGKMVAYIATHIDAYLTSATTYEAGGVGVAYVTATGKPIPGQFNVTQTRAIAS